MDALDIENRDALLAYLWDQGRVDRAEHPVMQTLRGGVSNRTVLLRRASGEAWVLKQALAKLRVPVDWFVDPVRVHREADGMRVLAALVPGSVPGLVFEDRTHHLIAMEAVPEPSRNWKEMLLSGELDREHVAAFGTLLGQIHLQSHRRDELAARFPDDFFDALRLEPYYRYSAEQVPESASFLHDLIDETTAIKLSLVHGDYSPKNVLVHQGHLFLLDHEVIHWGDPTFDLGFSMTHFLSKAHHLPEQRRAFAGATLFYWQAYRAAAAELVTPELEARAVRHTLGCLLGRAAGRSPLEYFGAQERSRQQRAVLELMRRPPHTVDELVQGFIERILA